MGLITDKGYVKHNYKNIIETNVKDSKSIADKLLSVDKVETTLLKENRWAK